MQRFMNLTGINSSIMLQTELALAPAAEYFEELYITDPEGLDEELEQVYDVGEIRMAILDYLVEESSTEGLEEVMAWFDDTFGRHIVSESLGAQRASQEDIEEYFDDFNPNDPDTAERLQLVNEIVTAKLDTDEFLPVYFDHYEALLETLDQFADIEEELDYDGTRIADDERLQLANQVMEMQVYIHLIGFRNTDLEDLRTYLEFLQAEEGSRYVDIYNKAQIGFLKTATERHDKQQTDTLMDEDEPAAEPIDQ